ncbi:hypothetical protein CJF31_00004332 [Rutstroemia sp. NJR-2017a BVV2]|nr:hypothetical protein CJF31_00004332 [Rutstroemia sp. NJR-2017a BVV2]
MRLRGPAREMNSEPKHFFIGIRLFPDFPKMVASFVFAQLKALRRNGMLKCPNHFLGHSDSAVNPHHGLPLIAMATCNLGAGELVPFGKKPHDRSHIASKSPSHELGSTDISSSILSSDAIEILHAHAD